MDIFSVITMFGGLAMFLFGMEVMGEGLKKSSGDTLRVLLQKLTRNTFTGLLTGMLVTAIIQASSATIVLTVGLLAAGILTLRQAISIVTVSYTHLDVYKRQCRRCPSWCRWRRR